MFLFDEPLSNLDAKLRAEMRRELAALHRRLGTTMIYVTHDQLEAMTLGDRIVVMNEGRVRQIGTPSEVYDHPRDTFVATFLGSPPMNLLPGTVSRSGGETMFQPDAQNGARVGIGAWTDRNVSRVLLGIRPEQLHVLPGDCESDPGAMCARVELVEPLGHEQLVYLRVGDATVIALTDRDHAPRPDALVRLALDVNHIHLFDEATGESIAR